MNIYTAAYSLSGVKKGTYTYWIFIDAVEPLVGDDETNPTMSNRDLYAKGSITISSNMILDVDAWSEAIIDI